MTRRKGLTREDLALWAMVARTVKPLPGRAPVQPPPAETAAQATTATTARPAAAPKLARAIPKPAPLQPLEEQLLRRLSRGKVEIEARIDLHGLRQDEAHGRLRAFIATQHSRGAKVVLVITGKGKSQASGFRDEVGVLKRQVPHWLAAPDLRNIVLGFEDAARHHGGEGALYVRLRRRRDGML
jgi:DNA-nicking Smr family endonuclease